MKVSLTQLEMVLSKMKYDLLGYGGKADLILDIDFSKEDPGSGAMVECLTLKAIKPSTADTEDSETRMEVEVYPEHEKLEPRASKIDSFKIKKSY